MHRGCEHVTSHGKRDFADVTKVKNLEMMILRNLNYPGGSNANSGILQSREHFWLG